MDKVKVNRNQILKACHIALAELNKLKEENKERFVALEQKFEQQQQKERQNFIDIKAHAQLVSAIRKIKWPSNKDKEQLEYSLGKLKTYFNRDEIHNYQIELLLRDDDITYFTNNRKTPLERLNNEIFTIENTKALCLVSDEELYLTETEATKFGKILMGKIIDDYESRFLTAYEKHYEAELNNKES